MKKEELQKAADAAGMCTSNFGLGQSLKVLLQHEADKLEAQPKAPNTTQIEVASTPEALTRFQQKKE